MFDYFYGAQSEQFSFIRIPTVLFSNDRFRNISTEAKVLYGMLLKRMDLSAKNGWYDSEGRVYIIFTLEESMETLKCADNKATKLLNELEKDAGLIEKKRQGLGKPNIIYVKNFISDVDNSGESAESRIKSRENHDSGVVKTTIQESLKSRGSYTDNKDTDIRDTDPIPSGEDDDGMRKRTDYENYFSLFDPSGKVPAEIHL